MEIVSGGQPGAGRGGSVHPSVTGGSEDGIDGVRSAPHGVSTKRTCTCRTLAVRYRRERGEGRLGGGWGLAKLCSGELTQGVLKFADIIQTKVVLCDSVRTSPSRHETEFTGFVFCFELADTVVGPLGYLDAISLPDCDGLSREEDDTGTGEIANQSESICMKFCPVVCVRVCDKVK